MTITVYGTPAPQGSKRHVGRGVMVESSAKVKPWREAVKWAALEQMKPIDPASPYFDVTAPERNRGGIFGPVKVHIAFTMPQPKRPKCAFPDRRPDLDKLVRSTLDALVEVGAIEDDARVIELRAWKVYPNGPGSIGVPGAMIAVMEAKV